MTIQDLINEYNEAEKQQAARLREIFAAVKARKGYRHVNFANDVMWSNCWDLPDRLDNKFFEKLNRNITDVQAGTE